MTSYGYDAVGNVTSIKDALGHETKVEYDKLGRRTASINEKGVRTTYEYSANGNLTAYTDPKGKRFTYTYDVLGRMLTETNPLGQITTYGYDATGNLTTVTNAKGGVKKFTYDGLDRIKTVTDENNGLTSYNYDANGNIIETIDPLGNATTYEYDALNQLVKVILPSTNQTGAQQTLYKYNKNGLVTEVIDASSKGKVYTYDANGNLVKMVDEDGLVTRYSYNTNDRISGIDYNEAKSVSYVYDKRGNLKEMTDWNGVTTFENDPLGRLTQIKDHLGNLTKYEYDETGNRKAIEYPDASKVLYEFDQNNKITKVIDGEDITTYEYDPLSNITKMAYPNGESTAYEYDALGAVTKKLESINNSPRKEVSYRYDNLGNKTQEILKDFGTNKEETTSYQYDLKSQLVQETDSKGTTSYGYDPRGNLLTEQKPTGTTNYRYNTNNELLEKIAPEGNTTFTYDQRGNKIKENTNGEEKNYTYDASNRLVQGINDQKEKIVYDYNGLGYRVNTEEWKENINQNHQNNRNSNARRTTVDIEGLIPENQKSYENAYGLTRETKNETTVTNFVPDYLSHDNRDLVSYEENGLQKKFVYGYDKISQEISMHKPKPTSTATGTTVTSSSAIETVPTVTIPTVANPESRIALETFGKVYFHQDDQKSSDFISDTKGNVILSGKRNAWGSLENKGRLNINFSGLEKTKDYTTHGYDEILGEYFAQYRMYDSESKRFSAKDTYLYTGNGDIAQGDLYPRTPSAGLDQNLYLYTENNPANMVDYLGHEGIPLRKNAGIYGISVGWKAASGGAKETVTLSKSGRSSISLTLGTMSSVSFYSGSKSVRSGTFYKVSGDAYIERKDFNDIVTSFGLKPIQGPQMVDTTLKSTNGSTSNKSGSSSSSSTSKSSSGSTSSNSTQSSSQKTTSTAVDEYKEKSDFEEPECENDKTTFGTQRFKTYYPEVISVSDVKNEDIFTKLSSGLTDFVESAAQYVAGVADAIADSQTLNIWSTISNYVSTKILKQSIEYKNTESYYLGRLVGDAISAGVEIGLISAAALAKINALGGMGAAFALSIPATGGLSASLSAAGLVITVTEAGAIAVVATGAVVAIGATAMSRMQNDFNNYKAAKSRGSGGSGKVSFKSTTTKSFWKDYEKLPKEIQKAADKAFEIFNNDPTSQSLHFEDMPELGKNVWSARINDKYRALGIKNGDTIEWYAITNHYR